MGTQSTWVTGLEVRISLSQPFLSTFFIDDSRLFEVCHSPHTSKCCFCQFSIRLAPVGTVDQSLDGCAVMRKFSGLRWVLASLLPGLSTAKTQWVIDSLGLGSRPQRPPLGAQCT